MPDRLTDEQLDRLYKDVQVIQYKVQDVLWPVCDELRKALNELKELRKLAPKYKRTCQSRKPTIVKLLDDLGQITSQMVADELGCSVVKASQSIHQCKKLGILKVKPGFERRRKKVYIPA